MFSSLSTTKPRPNGQGRNVYQQRVRVYVSDQPRVTCSRINASTSFAALVAVRPRIAFVSSASLGSRPATQTAPCATPCRYQSASSEAHPHSSRTAATLRSASPCAASRTASDRDSDIRHHRKPSRNPRELLSTHDILCQRDRIDTRRYVIPHVLNGSRREVH